MASETRRARGHTPACARKTRWRQTGNSCLRRASSLRISIWVMALFDVHNLSIESEPEGDDLIGGDEEHGDINQPGEHAGGEPHKAQSFLLVMFGEAGEGLINAA